MTPAAAVAHGRPVELLTASSVHELLGWNIWSAQGRQARVQVLRDRARLQVVLAEEPDPTHLGAGRRPGETTLVLGADGHCTAARVASSSVLHVLHADSMAEAANRDGERSALLVEFGDVLVATTAAFRQAAPAELIAQIPAPDAAPTDPGRTRRGAAAPGPSLPWREHAAIVFARRVWPLAG